MDILTEFIGLASPVVTPTVANLTGSPVSPGITNILPNPAAVGTSVTITGTNFGATQGGSTVTFNGTTASPTSWSATSITVPVPAGATTGNAVVTVGGLPSNGYSFTVSPASPKHHKYSAEPGGSGNLGDDYGDEFWRNAGREHGDVQWNVGFADELGRGERSPYLCRRVRRQGTWS